MLQIDRVKVGTRPGSGGDGADESDRCDKERGEEVGSDLRRGGGARKRPEDEAGKETKERREVGGVVCEGSGELEGGEDVHR